MSGSRPPEHMDQWSRNERLYETLKGMGLYVVPIPVEGNPDRIDHLHVSAALPAYVSKLGRQQAAERLVDDALERTQVARDVLPASGERDNVVDLPAVRR